MGFGGSVDLGAALVGGCIALLGVVGVLSPPRLFALVELLQSQAGLYLVTGIRIAVGVVLFLAAEGSRAPAYLRILGVLAVVSGVATPLFGLSRFEELLRWWRARPTGTVRLWCAAVVVLGASVVLCARPAVGS